MNTTPLTFHGPRFLPVWIPCSQSIAQPLEPALNLALTSTGITAEQRPPLLTWCLCSCSHFISASGQHRGCAALSSAVDFMKSSAFGGDDTLWLRNKLSSLSGMAGCELFLWIFRYIDAMVMTLFYMCLELRIRPCNESKINCLIHVSRGSKHPTRYRHKIRFK